MMIKDMNDLLGEELLSSLLNISNEKLRGYITKPNTMPGDMIDRIDRLSGICRNLQRKPPVDGIHGWFFKERRRLQHKRPVDILKGDWWPRHPDVLTVLELSDSLRG